MITDDEKELIRELKEKIQKYREMIRTKYSPYQMNTSKMFPNIDLHSDEFLIQAYNLSDADKVEFAKSGNPEKHELVITNAVLKNIDFFIDISTKEKKKLHEIRQYLDDLQDKSPEIFSPLNNSDQPGKKIEFDNIDLRSLIDVKDLSTLNWVVIIKNMQKQKKRREERSNGKLHRMG